MFGLLLIFSLAIICFSIDPENATAVEAIKNGTEPASVDSRFFDLGQIISQLLPGSNQGHQTNPDNPGGMGFPGNSQFYPGAGGIQNLYPSTPVEQSTFKPIVDDAKTFLTQGHRRPSQGDRPPEQQYPYNINMRPEQGNYNAYPNGNGYPSQENFGAYPNQGNFGGYLNQENYGNYPSQVNQLPSGQYPNQGNYGWPPQPLQYPSQGNFGGAHQTPFPNQVNQMTPGPYPIEGNYGWPQQQQYPNQGYYGGSQQMPFPGAPVTPKNGIYGYQPFPNTNQGGFGQYPNQGNFGQYPSQGNNGQPYPNQGNYGQNQSQAYFGQQYPNQGNFGQQYPNQGNFGSQPYPGQNGNQNNGGQWPEQIGDGTLDSVIPPQPPYTNDQNPNVNGPDILDMPDGNQMLNESDSKLDIDLPDKPADQDSPDKDTSAILGNPVIIPESTVSPDQIYFPTSSTESPSLKRCVQDCETSSEYDPVCGTDNITYINPAKFVCARNCGFNVFVLKKGSCPTKK